MLNPRNSRDRETRERAYEQDDNAMAKANKSCWSRLPVWLKGLVALAILGGVFIAVRYAATASSQAIHAEREQAAMAMEPMSVTIADAAVIEEEARVHLHPNAHAHAPFNPAHGRRVFIDAGAKDGNTLRLFAAHGHVTADTTIYAFEPSPEYADAWKALKEQGAYPHLTFEPLAVWTVNTTLTLAQKGADSTVFAGTPVTHDVDALQGVPKVTAVDFDEFLRAHVTTDDHVTVMFNAEGAELPVLERLIGRGTIELIDVLYVECHYASLTGLFPHVTEHTCQNLCHQIVPHGVQFFFWSRVHPKGDGAASDRKESGFQWLDRYAVQGTDCDVLTTSALDHVVDGRHSAHISASESLDRLAADSSAHHSRSIAVGEGDSDLHTTHSAEHAQSQSDLSHDTHVPYAQTSEGAHHASAHASAHAAADESEVSDSVPMTHATQSGLAESAAFVPVHPAVGDHLNSAAVDHGVAPAPAAAHSEFRAEHASHSALATEHGLPQIAHTVTDHVPATAHDSPSAHAHAADLERAAAASANSASHSALHDDHFTPSHVAEHMPPPPEPELAHRPTDSNSAHSGIADAIAAATRTAGHTHDDDDEVNHPLAEHATDPELHKPHAPEGHTLPATQTHAHSSVSISEHEHAAMQQHDASHATHAKEDDDDDTHHIVDHSDTAHHDPATSLPAGAHAPPGPGDAHHPAGAQVVHPHNSAEAHAAVVAQEERVAQVNAELKALAAQLEHAKDEEHRLDAEEAAEHHASGADHHSAGTEVHAAAHDAEADAEADDDASSADAEPDDY